MTSTGYLNRSITFRARRDTVLLVVVATSLTFALASTIHSRPTLTAAPAVRDWTGSLTDLVDVAPVAKPAPLTSASLVVPASDLALPDVPMRALVRLRGCDNSICRALPSKVNATPQRRTISIAQSDSARRRRARTTIASGTNPLNHIPEMLTRPFAVAGDKVAEWFKRF